MDDTVPVIEPVSSPPSEAIETAIRNDNSNPQQGTGAGTGTARSMTSVNLGTLPSHGRPSLKIPPNKKDSRKLFVGGLPVDITEDEFRTFFGQFGKLMDCIVMVDRDTNRSRGFGFVSYEDPDVARKLLAMGREGPLSPGEPVVGRLEMRGKTIEVKAAQPRDIAPNRRHFYRNDRRANQTVGPPSLTKTDPTVAAFTPSYEYASAYYPYYPPPMVSGYTTPHGYFPMIQPATPGDMNYFQYAHYPFGPGFAAYQPHHLPATAAAHRAPSIHPVAPGVKSDDRPASTTATVA